MRNELLAIIVCPSCRGNLILSAKKNELLCLSSRLAYPIVDGIPVLIKSEARSMEDSDLTQ
ncbi:MAG: Trm112 family protein [Tatlockia sp.]|nr:Trm112 family protein [Tatlockia sp.]